MSDHNSNRRAWLRTLALTPAFQLEAAWSALSSKPMYRLVRPVQIGLAMVRGRIEGNGTPFNLGEITVTHAIVELEGRLGSGYVIGRAPRHAELVAVFDGMLQDQRRYEELMTPVIEPLLAAIATKHQGRAAAVADTMVNFFTLARDR